MMYRFLNLSLIICVSVSLMFVGVESMSELPPLKNFNFRWETPFGLSLTWDKPEDLEPKCIAADYTVVVTSSTDCSSDVIENRKVTSNNILLNLSNVKGLCICVTTNLTGCGEKNIPKKIITIDPPPVQLVENMSLEYSLNHLKCTWKPAVDVKNLSFCYWYERMNSPMRCIPTEEMTMEGCVIHDLSLTYHKIFFLFNGTYNGTVVNNTFREKSPQYYVKLNKPQLTIHRNEDTLVFKTNGTDLYEFEPKCYEYHYTISKESSKNVDNFTQITNGNLDLPYDSSCKYRARVQIIFSSYCGSGNSIPSDEVEYGENSDPNLSALLALIIIPVVVSCCLIVFLVLLRRNKDMLFPEIPDPSLLFKEMLINNVQENLRPDSEANKLYIPIEETVEYKISLERNILLAQNTTNEPQNQE